MSFVGKHTYIEEGKNTELKPFTNMSVWQSHWVRCIRSEIENRLIQVRDCSLLLVPSNQVQHVARNLERGWTPPVNFSPSPEIRHKEKLVSLAIFGLEKGYGIITNFLFFVSAWSWFEFRGFFFLLVRVSPGGVVANLLDYYIGVSEFKLSSRY